MDERRVAAGPVRRALTLAVALASWAIPAPCRAGDPVVVSGQVTMVTADSVSVAGRSGMLGPQSDLRSDGHPVSRASLREGMAVRMELDDAGNILEIRTTGVLE